MHGENLQLGIVEVLDLESSFWRTEHSYSTTTPCDRLPANSQRQLLELDSLKDRAQEEKQLCIGDLVRTTVFYHKHLNEIISKVVQCLQQHDDQLIHLLQDDLATTNGNSIHSLPRPAAGTVAALLLTRKLSLLKMKRAEQVLHILVNAYWRNILSNSDVKECQTDVKFLPPIRPLVIDSSPASTIESNNSDSDDSFYSTFDDEFDFDSCFESSSTD